MLDIVFESTPLFLGGVFIFGLLIGSFLNVVILRLPARLEHEWRGQCRDLLALESTEDDPVPPGLVLARSRCPKCQRPIRAHENIPLVSWLMLRGRCAGCKARISLRYPIVEAVTAVLFVITAWHFGPTVQGAAAIAMTGVLIALTGIDLDHQLLPDQLTLPLLWAGLVASLWAVFIGPAASIVGAAVGYLSLWSVYWLFKLFTGKEGMGYGDFKLMAALGAWMGWTMVPLVIVLSSVVGATVGIAMLLARRHERGQPIPFGPFIAAAGWIALLWGDRILARYLGISGLS